MKKSFALIGMGVAMAGAPAMAFEISPYAALRLTGSVVNNDMTVIADYSFGGVKHHVNTMADETHSDFAFGANAAIGAKLDLGYGALRGEFAFDWKSDATDDNDFYFKVKTPYVHNFESTTSLYDVMFNLYYDFDTGTSFVPFLTAGLGYGHIALSAAAAGKTMVQWTQMSNYPSLSWANFCQLMPISISQHMNSCWVHGIHFKYLYPCGKKNTGIYRCFLC